MARRAQEDLVQLNANGSLNHVIVTGLHALPDLYVCANPANDHLFVTQATYPGDVLGINVLFRTAEVGVGGKTAVFHQLWGGCGG